MDITGAYLRERYPSPPRENVSEQNKFSIKNETKTEVIELLDQFKTRLGSNYIDQLVEARIEVVKRELTN